MFHSHSTYVPIFFFAGTIFLFEAHCTDVTIFLVEAFIYLLAIMLY